MTFPPDEIEPKLLQFIHASIDSVEQLQVLLLLVDRPGEKWTVDKLSQELRSSQSSVQKRIQDLHNRKVLAPGAVAEDGSIHFAASSPEVEELIRELAKLHQQRPHRVIALIYNKPPAAIQSFADAFKFKKEDS